MLLILNPAGTSAASDRVITQDYQTKTAAMRAFFRRFSK
jgi:hypothetical protein